LLIGLSAKVLSPIAFGARGRTLAPPVIIASTMSALDERVEYATAERCLAHAVGSDAALAYDRSDRPELRRPVMTRWAQFVLPPPLANVIELRRAGA
jgi:hypothetical protein